MTPRLLDFQLNTLSTDELNQLLADVMSVLRQRDAQDLRMNLAKKSQRLTLSEQIERHINRQ